MALTAAQKQSAYRARKRHRKDKMEADATAAVQEILNEFSADIYAHVGKLPDGSLQIIWRFPREAEERLALVAERYTALGLPNIVDTLNAVIVGQMNLQNGQPLWEAGAGSASARMTKEEVLTAIEAEQHGEESEG